jgi:hypothetical protein
MTTMTNRATREELLLTKRAAERMADAFDVRQFRQLNAAYPLALRRKWLGRADYFVFFFPKIA